ncbi:MAG: DUF1566 domain-containing protein [bacterium]
MKKNKYGWLAAVIMSLLFISSLAQAGTVDLPQTGQTKCYDTAGTEISCTDTGQDGDIRAGVPWPAPRFMNNGDSTVTDNLTGLIWTQNAGTPTVGSCTGGYKNWQGSLDYVTCLNNINYLGHSDWRLPNVNELESLINADEPNSATWLNVQGFTNVQSSYYWSSSSYADDTGYAWIVNMWYGYVDVGYGNKTVYDSIVWPVRSGQSTAPSQVWKTGQILSYAAGDDGALQRGVSWPVPRFTDHGNSTVTDNLTGLMWTKDAYAPGPSACSPGITKTWQGALDYAACLNANSDLGYTDWRVPNRKELRSLVDYSRYNPALPTNNPFSNVQQFTYWSSSSNASNTNSAWLVGMLFANVVYYNKTIAYDNHVWPVRSGQSGSFDILDHFDFDPISSPQTVGAPFNVKITAKNAGGQLVTTFSGPVTLTCNVGSLSKSQTTFANGVASLQVSMDSPGNNARISAVGGGASGAGSPFDVNGVNADQGSIGGIVTDSDGNRLTGADVHLSSGMGFFQQGTVNGNYQFSNLPCGTYWIWAIYNGTSSKAYTVSLSCDRCVAQDLLVPTCNPNNTLTPILLVPGFPGSSTGKGMACPTLTKDYMDVDSPAWVQESWGLHDPFGHPGWRGLINDLELMGYKKDCTLFSVPYDWRRDVDTIAKDYLKKKIEEAKTQSGKDHVDIIAHSMGGLVTRAYIQGSSYGYDIEKFAMVGTPNHGAANAYYMWEGGDPKLADDLKGDGIDFNSNTLNLLYESMRDEPLYPLVIKCTNIIFCNLVRDFDNPNYDLTAMDFIQTEVPPMKQLLPTYDFLIAVDPFGITQNQWLKDLNTNVDLKGVNTEIFAGYANGTIKLIFVGLPNDLYLDGFPLGDPQKDTTGDGDGTVLTSLSAKLDEASVPIITHQKTGEHDFLIQTYNNDEHELIQFVTGSLPPAGPLYRAKAVALQNTVALSFFGRISPYITDPSGSKSGINPATNVMEDGIPESTVAIDTDSGRIYIENAIDGVYTVDLKSVRSEDYRLILSYMDPVTTLQNEFMGFSHAGTTSFTFTVDSASTEKMTIDHPPSPPTGLQADAVDSEGLKTRLTWSLSADPAVTGYNLYAKYTDEPYLAQIGISSGNSFDTGDPWAENASIPTRLYAISAVKADGTESFLSGMVKNDDRDHDGLSDEKEVLYGTDMTKPDTDGDGLTDSEEIVRGTNPLLADTDGDTYSDYDEVKAASDPLDSSSLPTPCSSSTDCGTEFYCAKPDGQCGDAGICEYKPSACDPIDDPVCGCDGITYQNACEASLAGVSVNYNGACDTDGDGIPDNQDNCPLISNPKQQDKDSDGVGNACDNCTLTANPSQCDANGDGYGNICDPDLDNNGMVETRDSKLFRKVFGTSDPDADFDCNGLVDIPDSRILKKYMGKPPGPSCIDTNPACKN